MPRRWTPRCAQQRLLKARRSALQARLRQASARRTRRSPRAGAAAAPRAALRSQLRQLRSTRSKNRSTPWIAGAKCSAAMFGGFYAGCALDPTCQWSIDRRGGRDGTPATTGMEDADRKKGSWLIRGHSHKAEKAKQLNAGIPEQNASNHFSLSHLPDAMNLFLMVQAMGSNERATR